MHVQRCSHSTSIALISPTPASLALETDSCSIRPRRPTSIQLEFSASSSRTPRAHAPGSAGNRSIVCRGRQVSASGARAWRPIAWDRGAGTFTALVQPVTPYRTRSTAASHSLISSTYLDRDGASHVLQHTRSPCPTRITRIPCIPWTFPVSTWGTLRAPNARSTWATWRCTSMGWTRFPTRTRTLRLS